MEGLLSMGLTPSSFLTKTNVFRAPADSTQIVVIKGDKRHSIRAVLCGCKILQFSLNLPLGQLSLIYVM